MKRIEFLLKVHFALLAAMGGLTLGFSDSSGSLPAIAILSTLIAFLFVDWLQLFALPPVLGYVAMGLIAAYSISEFIPLSPANDRHLMVVAELLVLVQAVLMLQRKSKRTFEQIGVFCLLEVIVAAVFNHSLSFVLLLIPLTLVGLSALTLLQLFSSALQMAEGQPIASRKAAAASITTTGVWIKTESPHSVNHFETVARLLPWNALTTLTPAVLLVGLVFFYAIPRTQQMGRPRIGLAPQVGFSNEITLQQIGKLQQNKQVVMRLALRDQVTQRPYELKEPVYLRGQVLSMYDFTEKSGRWQVSHLPLPIRRQPLPTEYSPRRGTDHLFFDRVEATIELEPLTTSTAFSIAPYYATTPLERIRHTPDSWLLARDDEQEGYARQWTSYRFGTTAFYHGRQIASVRALAAGEERLLRIPRLRREYVRWRRQDMEFDPKALPELTRLADQVVGNLPADERNPRRIATALTRFLTAESGLQYTLDLSMREDPALDPIEQFLTVHRRGNCQYFATALALMLRSQKIPARLVVGFRTDEFSPYGQQYIARQLHAHAWVEALLDEREVQDEHYPYGQPPDGPVWLRLDPTPAAFEPPREGQITQVFDHMTNLFEKRFLFMDGARQRRNSETEAIDEGTGETFFRNLVHEFRQWGRSGFGGGALAGREWFSWPAAVVAILITTTILGSLRLNRPVWRWQRKVRFNSDDSGGDGPLTFFAELMQLMRKMGYQRQTSQTPREFTAAVADSLNCRNAVDLKPELSLLTQLYYGIRYGHAPTAAADSQAAKHALNHVAAAVEKLKREKNKSP